jgi:hypothetical protein
MTFACSVSVLWPRRVNYRNTERCQSGRSGQTRNLLYRVTCTVGSNPTLSAIIVERR